MCLRTRKSLALTYFLTGILCVLVVFYRNDQPKVTRTDLPEVGVTRDDLPEAGSLLGMTYH